MQNTKAPPFWKNSTKLDRLRQVPDTLHRQLLQVRSYKDLCSRPLGTHDIHNWDMVTRPGKLTVCEVENHYFNR